MNARRWNLQFRMLLSIGLLAALAVALVVAVWGVFVGVLAVLGAASPIMAALLTVGLLGSLVAVESRRRPVDRVTGAVEASPAAYPELHATTTRVASMLDVPKPSIEVADSRVPEAMVVGLRPDSARFIVSSGTLEALSDDELEAVVAHELAHLRNRDAMVMTVVSTPAVLADELKGHASEALSGGGHPVIVAVMLPLFAISAVGWLLARTVVAVLSRARERVADRAAAEVTGSPAALASALRTLDDRIAETPTGDLRAAEGVSSLSILPLTPAEATPVMLGPDGDVEPFLWSVRAPLRRLSNRLFRTHPPTAQRLEALAELERRERRGDVVAESTSRV